MLPSCSCSPSSNLAIIEFVLERLITFCTSSIDECDAAPIPCISECARERTYADVEDVLVLGKLARGLEGDRDLPAPVPTTLTFALPKEEWNDRADESG